MKTLIVIPNYNTGPYLADCLRAIIRDHKKNKDKHGDIFIRVIENGSDDDSVSIIDGFHNDYPDLIYPTYLTENIGIYPAWNLAIGFTVYGQTMFKDKAAYDVVILGADTEVQPGWLVEFQEAVKNYPNIGIQSAKLFQLENYRRKVIFGGTRNVFGKWHVQGWDDSGEFDKLKQYPWVTFSAVWISKKVLAKVGPFDTEFNIYGGDRDYCYRAAAEGFWIFYNGFAEVIHHEGKGVTERKKRDADFANLIVEDHRRLYRLYGEIDKNIPPHLRVSWDEHLLVSPNEVKSEETTDEENKRLF